MALNQGVLLLSVSKFSAVVLCAITVQIGFAKAERLVSKECSLTCESKECLYQSNMLMKHVNLNLDPCQDFYSFACGGYLEKFGEDDTRSTYDDTWNALLIRTNDLLENLQPNTGSVSEKLKSLYDICMDKESSETKAVPEALDFLNQVGISNWPNLDPTFQFDELSKTLGTLAVYGQFSFITFQPSPYEERNDHQPALILPDKYLINSKLSPKDIKNAVLKILSYFNFDSDEAETVWEIFKSIEEDGTKLQNEEPKDNSSCNGASSVQYAKVNCSEETYDSMAFLCNFWKSAVESGNLSRYYSSEILHISCRWNHYNYIENIISRIVSLNHRSLANYLSLRFFTSHLDDLNLYFQLTKKRFSKPKDPEYKTTETLLRMEYCVGWIIKSMPLALGFEYTLRFVNESVEMEVLDIVQDYVQELSHDIENQNWINEKVKFYLKRQLGKLEIGFKKSMKNFRNGTNLENYYKEFQPLKGSFLKNILEYTKTSVTTKKEIPDFNSFYSSSDSYSMDFGLSLFLPPTYSYGLLKMLNYATLGWIIGHELSHNLKFFFDIVQLDEETASNLNSRLECYVNQFSRFILEKTGKGVISKETEEEIIADNIGWILTEKIIKSFNVSTDIYLPGINFSPLQIIYISFAQDSCAALNKQVEQEFYASKPHNLQNLRVLSILQNSKAFSEAFNCSTTQTMNPSNKCVFFY